MRWNGISLLSLIFVLSAALSWGQETKPLVNGTVERITVHGKGLEGNLSGDPADRPVMVYLPPSYGNSPNRRYPVLYFLHGFTDSPQKWFQLKTHWINLPTVLDQALAAPGAHDMIVVMPDAYTRFQGSMYSRSVTTGNWEDFVAKELVAYIDSHYRTVAAVASRGLAGHSMGGYGTLRVGMKYPEVFSSLYALSPCCLIPGSGQQMAPLMAKAEAVRSPEEIAQADFLTKAMLASAAAWSPNPQSPPLYVDLPTREGQLQPLVLAKWAANAPLAMVDQYIPNLKALHAVALDAGNKDEQIAAASTTLHEILNRYSVSHTFEIYEGTHTSRIAERIQAQVIPYFSKNLAFPSASATK